MKQISILLVLGFALSLCNLTNKLKNAGNPGKSSTSSTDTGGAPVEHGEPTAAQVAALAGGQTVKWDKQGMSWTLPPKWRQDTNEEKMFGWSSSGSGAASLNVNISAMDENFPTDVSLKAYYDSTKSRAKNGEVDEFKWVEIDGLKGVQFRESNPEKPDGIRRLQWLAYRKFAGQVQFVNVMLASSGKDFPRHQDAMYGILYSTKIVH